MWNTRTSFGPFSKSLHWLGALLIFAMIGLGLWAVQSPLQTPEQMAAAWQLFALHKTIGVCAFGFGVVRLASMAMQLRPEPIASHGQNEVSAARTVHWLLAALMVLVPLAGWVRHASLPGFAPLYLPFGDSLPFVPADPQLSEIVSSMHFGFVALLVVAVLAHITGALKHHLIDRDGTLIRMLPGRSQPPQTQHIALNALPPVLALGLIAGVAVIAVIATPPV